MLTDEPTVFSATGPGPGGGPPVPSRGGGRDSAARVGGSGAPTTGDDLASLLDAVPEGDGADEQTRRLVQQIAARLTIPRPRRERVDRRGAGELTSVRFRGTSDDIDLDATLERLAERPVPEEDDIVVREQVRTRRSVVLLVDASGSMRGERAATAAATVAALAAELARDDLAVLAFWSDAAWLTELGRPTTVTSLLDMLVRLPARGLTNVEFPLRLARGELARVPVRDARVVLLSDCVHNAGPDPRDAAARLPRLDVLLDTSGERDADLARDLARLGRGRLRVAATARDVAPALSSFFADER